jgi:DUF4097 and DUF4098 domain-containing protein YvlB
MWNCYHPSDGEIAAGSRHVTQPTSLPPRPLLRINAKSGNVAVSCEDRADIVVERASHGADPPDVSDTEITITAWSDSVVVRCPRATNLNIGSLSGRVDVFGDAGDVRIGTASGAITVERAARTDLRSISGRLDVGECGDCRLSTKSGRVMVSSAHRVEIATVSGRIALDRAAGTVKVKSVSGVVEVGATGRDDVEVQTLSGSVTVRLPEGTRPQLRVKSLGKARNSFPAGDDCRVAVSTLSGKVELVAG